jgi:hypothetical protein
MGVEGKLFEIRSKDVPLGAFVVVLLPEDVEPGSEVSLKDCAIAFEGTGNLAGDLIGQGVVINLVDKGGMVGVVLNPDEPATITGEDLPDHVE